MSKALNNKPEFWRDERMPHLELRRIEDGQHISYGAHSHKEWSIGAITQGQCTYVNGSNQYNIDSGSLVFMNPEQMHACNPIDGQAWAYYMLYIDSEWLTNLRLELGLIEKPIWQNIPAEWLKDSHLYLTFVQLCETLMQNEADLLQKQSELVLYLTNILTILTGTDHSIAESPDIRPVNIRQAANYIDLNIAENMSLDTLCGLAKCSQGHLIKAFRKHYGFTPHAYLINRRIQFAQTQLKNGHSIAEVALSTGFSDQAHFQRVFKKHVAATPKQYR